jgi:8-oxo-dGTP pyrophosphatase MutT (NUDIX family)
MPSQFAVPIPAATVLLLRDSARGLEVFMVLRHHQIDAFSGALVFPGGKVDAADQHADLIALCRSAHAFSADTLALRVAAIREAFEECGVLLARTAGEQQLIDAQQLDKLDDYRRALLANSLDMIELCRAENLELATDLLSHYAHWITPKIRPKIFDTYFFLAPAPAGQLAVHDGSESLDSMWITPQQAIAQATQGKLTLVFPTRMNLLRLAHSTTVQQAMTAAQQSEVITVQPQVEVRDDGHIMSIPEHAGYDASRVFISSDGRHFDFLS